MGYPGSQRERRQDSGEAFGVWLHLQSLPLGELLGGPGLFQLDTVLSGQTVAKL